MMRRVLDQRGQALVEFAVSAMAFALLIGALLILDQAAGTRVRVVEAARYAAWHHLTTSDTGTITRTFFEGRPVRVTVGGRTTRPLGLATARLQETFDLPVLLYLTGRGRVVRAEAEVTAETHQAEAGLWPEGRSEAKAVVATDPWDGLRGVELGVAVTGQWDLLPVLLPFSLL